MKRLSILLVLVIALLSNLDIKAQYNHYPPPDAEQYDLLYVFDTSFFVDCFMTNDTNRTWYNPEGGYFQPYANTYQKWGWYLPYYKAWCDPSVPNIDGYVIGANSYTEYGENKHIYAEAFAQEYGFTSTTMPYDNYIVCGVAMKIGFNELDTYRNVCILDNNFDTISNTIFHTFNAGPTMEEIVNWNPGSWNTYYFSQRDYGALTNIDDFKIAFDVPKFGSNNFHLYHTCSVYSPCLRDSIFANGGPIQCGLNYDTIYAGMVPWNQLYYNLKDSLTGVWYSESFHPNHYSLYGWVNEYLDMVEDYGPEDNIPLCSFTDPKYLRHEGQWINFEDDTAYTIWQNIYIAMVPIIMIPRSEQSLSEVELEKMCYLMPNPTKDYFRVMSHYTINSIQVFDMVGKMLIEKDVNYFEKEIDISNLSAGSYVVKINTAKGSVKKKLIVE